jgi:hypothetical protein
VRTESGKVDGSPVYSPLKAPALSLFKMTKQ